MKLVRYGASGEERPGLWDGENVRDLSVRRDDRVNLSPRAIRRRRRRPHRQLRLCSLLYILRFGMFSPWLRRPCACVCCAPAFRPSPGELSFSNERTESCAFFARCPGKSGYVPGTRASAFRGVNRRSEKIARAHRSEKASHGKTNLRGERRQATTTPTK